MTLLISIGIFTVIIFGIEQFKVSSQLASVKQVTNLSHILVRQQANLFAILLKNNASSESLSENLDLFAKEQFVLDASLYGDNGERLAQSQSLLSLRSQLGLTEEKNTLNTQQIVEPIYDKDSLIGFLRVTFDADYGQTSNSKINQQFLNLYAEIVIILLVGALITSSLYYYFQRTRTKIITLSSYHDENKKVKNNTALLYHQRRKRFRR